MSIDAVNWALRQPLKGCQKFVLVALAYHANSETKCWPGLQILADECGITRSSVINHINTLTTLGLLSKEKRTDPRGYRRSTLYQLHLHKDVNAQSLKTQRRENQRRDFDNQSPDFDISKVQNLDGNIIERSLERTIENTTPCKVETLPEVNELFQYWQKVLEHPRAKLDNKRKRKIEAALRLGYAMDELKQAIDGCTKDPFSMGQNERGQKFDDIELILRDASHIDKFIRFATTPTNSNTNSSIPDWMASSI